MRCTPTIPLLRRPSARRGERGLTLIELMIVAAIMGIIVAVAIPNFKSFQMKSRTAEGRLNVDAIRKAEITYYAEHGIYVSASPSPPAPPGSVAATFSDTGGGFTAVGWSPEGQIRFNYAVAVVGGAYTVDASADMDSDTTPQVWGYVHRAADTSTVQGALGCIAVFDRESGGVLFDTVGPCEPTHGASVF